MLLAFYVLILVATAIVILPYWQLTVVSWISLDDFMSFFIVSCPPSARKEIRMPSNVGLLWTSHINLASSLWSLSGDHFPLIGIDWSRSLHLQFNGLKERSVLRLWRRGCIVPSHPQTVSRQNMPLPRWRFASHNFSYASRFPCL